MEFQDYRSCQIKLPITDDDIKKHFKTYDLNGDGFIISSELALVMKVIHKKSFTKKEIDDIFDEVDSNSDGKATYPGRSLPA